MMNCDEDIIASPEVQLPPRRGKRKFVVQDEDSEDEDELSQKAPPQPEPVPEATKAISSSSQPQDDEPMETTGGEVSVSGGRVLW